MDLNYLYHRHQVSVMMADAATSVCARIVHQKMSDAYAKRIADGGPPGDRARDWTTWEAYQSIPDETGPKHTVPAAADS